MNAICPKSFFNRYNPIVNRFFLIRVCIFSIKLFQYSGIQHK